MVIKLKLTTAIYCKQIALPALLIVEDLSLLFFFFNFFSFFFLDTISIVHQVFRTELFEGKSRTTMAAAESLKMM